MKKLLALILCAAVLTAVFPFSQTAYAAGGDTDAGMLDEIVIEFFDKSLFPDKEKQYEDEVAKVLKDGLSVVTDNVYVVKAENLSKNPTATLNKYKNSKFIVYAEPNYTIKADAAPNDPGYKSYTAAYNALNAAAGWDIVKSGGPVVAVVDSGTALNPDLPKLLAGYAAVAGLSPNNDKLGHGTGVAGTIGALGNNGIGTVGINWNASIIPVKVDDANGIMSVANVAKGIMWAVDNGAKIINLSLGTTSDSITLKNAIDYAYNKGCALFAATGNESASSLCYPARYANVMAVGSTGNGTTRLSSSNYGPGMGVVALSSYYTTTSAGGYMPMAGTSFATPQAAGLASLIWALNPALTNDQVYSYIQQGAKPLGGGYNEQTGYGLIDIGKTLQLVRDNTQPKVIDTTAPVLTLLGNVIMELKLGENFMEPGYTAIDDTDGNITAKVTVTGAVNVNVAGVYRLEYAVADAAGNTATATRIVEIVYTDDTPPVLTLKGASNMQLRQGDSFVEPGYTAIDNVDGDITNKVVVAGTVDIQTPGEYVLEYKVADAAGNMAAALRVVEVIQLDTTPPVLTLKGASNMEILQGNSFVEPGYTAIDNVDGDISSKVSVSGMVNSEVAEEYALDYRVADAAGNVAFARRVVTVLAKTEEKTYTLPPTLTLFGSPGMQIFCGEDFSEPGYTAYDCLGADLTSAVYIANNVDNEHEGVYTVNYSVEDLGGQTARATRTVTVAERETPPPPTGAPTITIIGSDPIILHLGSDTPYTEQGAYAYDNFEGDLSALVQISGYV
ncbi:MAG: DUF5011 domain-containing protein, partial [Firmicutes bacterium]|nr:DUF5011 domain-containing protein [Bacillota bacterium]